MMESERLQPLLTLTGEAFFRYTAETFARFWEVEALLVLSQDPAAADCPRLVSAHGPDGHVAACVTQLEALGDLRQLPVLWYPEPRPGSSPPGDSGGGGGMAKQLLGGRLIGDDGRLLGFLAGFRQAQDPLPTAQKDLLRFVLGRAAGELQRSEQERLLTSQLDLQQTVLDAIPLPIFYKDAQGRYLGCNRSFEHYIGHPREEILGREVYGVAPPELAEVYRKADLELLAKGGTQVYEASVENAGGSRARVMFHKAVFLDAQGRKAGIAGTMINVTRQREAEDEARYLAHFDPVTGLPNQTLFRDRLEQELRHAQRCEEEIAVFCLDLDRFKKVNTAFGHDFGDRALSAVARCLTEIIGDDGTVARLGGDSFMLMTVLGPGRRKPQDTASLLGAAVRRPLDVDGRRLHLSASVGIAVFPHDGDDAVTLLRNAAAAQSRTREKDPGFFRFFTPAMNTRACEQLILEEHLRRALDREEFFLLYQPQVDAVSGQLIGAEALLRWQHPEWGLVEPGRFIAMAEETRLIQPLGEMILRMACRQASRWWRETGCKLRVVVNLSPLQFQVADLVDRIRQILLESGLPPRGLGLEITETEVMRDFDHGISCLTRLRELGVYLAIDDFGTGYSSLSYLKHFPIDLLKVDRSFVTGLPDDYDDAAIVSAIVALARSLGLRVMAEGVETAAQEEFLRNLGCSAFQGYRFGRPLPPAEFARIFLNAKGSAPPPEPGVAASLLPHPAG